MEIRFATPSDAPALSAIYRYYVENTAISFEYAAPTEEEFQARIEKTLSAFPYLVACDGDTILGYAYAAPFRTRPAYRHWAEASIYIHREHRGSGIGAQLYAALESILAQQNIFTVCACIAHTDREDAHLTDASVRFHTRMGYRETGIHENCGYKFGKWYSIICMEKSIVPTPAIPDPFIPFPQLDRKKCDKNLTNSL